MKTAVFWLATLGVFGVANAMIASKEAAIRTGETMYLELAPRDPRSLMQGDYMALDYQVERSAFQGRGADRRGKLVVRLEENRVARFVRFHAGEKLAPGEHLLRYRRAGGGIEVGANAFFFQEGHADFYGRARYGEYKVAKTGESVLVALRNADFTKAGPPGE
jgi:uncharacterized membrane-anchored protein